MCTKSKFEVSVARLSASHEDAKRHEGHEEHVYKSSSCTFVIFVPS